MKKCPYCAEDVQDAAVVCKHCGRNIAGAAPTPRHAASSSGAPPTASDRRTGYLALFVIAAAIAVVFISRMPSAGAPSIGQQGVLPRFEPPQIITIASTADIDVDAGKVQRWDWTVGPGRPRCHLAGRIEVTDGGNKDVQVFVMSADDYTNWANGHPAKVFFQTEKTTVITLDVNTAQAGPMVLALSNAFSVLQRKRVHLQDVQVTCR